VALIFAGPPPSLPQSKHDYAGTCRPAVVRGAGRLFSPSSATDPVHHLRIAARYDSLLLPAIGATAGCRHLPCGRMLPELHGAAVSDPLGGGLFLLFGLLVASAPSALV
jgi:hypothetical protein